MRFTVAKTSHENMDFQRPLNNFFWKLFVQRSANGNADYNGQILVHEMQDPGISSIIAELTSHECGKQFYLLSFDHKDNKIYEDIKNLFLGKNSFTLGIRRKNENLLLPPPNTPLMSEDRAIVIADTRPK